MGAEQFYNRIKGNDARESFRKARESACYENGNGGYSGTIAEKSSYIMSRKPSEIDAVDWVDKVESFDEDDTTQSHYYDLKHDYEVYDDKWGEALCVPTEDGFIFCGWASA